MDLNLELSIERRFAACKNKFSEWIDYEPDKINQKETTENDISKRTEKMRSLSERWKTGLIVQDEDQLLCIGKNNTVVSIDEKPIENVSYINGIQWMLAQKNVRKIFSNGLVFLVLYMDGNVNYTVTYSDTRGRSHVKYAKELINKCRVLDGWSNVKDVIPTYREFIGLDNNGYLKIVNIDNSVYDNTDWANNAVDVCKVGDIDQFLLYYIDYKGKIHYNKAAEMESYKKITNSERYNKIINIENKIDFYAFGENYAACLLKNNRVKASWDAAKIDLSSVNNWPEMVTIMEHDDTLIGLAPNGVVYAAGKKAKDYEGWTNIAFLTVTGFYVYGVRWDGSCICTNKEINLSKADFSWLFEDEN